MTWGSRRKLYYGGLACIIVAIFLFINIYPKLNVAPTCFDGKKNADEHGIDCGGNSCAIICQADTTPLVIKWSRSFKVGQGFYNAFAYIENQNIQASSKIIYYEFSIYDTDNIFITSRQGYTYIPSNGRFGIFEPAINTGKRIPKNTSFRFLTNPVWEKVTAKQSMQSFFAEATAPSNLDIAPRLDVVVSNPSLDTVRNIDVYSIVYGADDNALNVSKTVIDSLLSGAQKKVTFTWREPWAGEPKRTEILLQTDRKSVV